MVAAILAGAQLAIGIAGQVSKHKGQARRERANRRSALSSMNLQYRDLAIRGMEEERAVRQQQDIAGLQTLQALGTARAGAAASGVGGHSVEAVDMALMGDLGAFRSTTDFNLTLTLDQIERRRRQVSAQAEAQIAGVERPSLAETALGIAGVGLRSFQTYDSYQNR